MIWIPTLGGYTDIDAYASAIAYADLLNQRGKPAKTYFRSQPNYSVPSALRLDTGSATFDLMPDDEVIILDLSKPEIIHQFVPSHQILELIDHHPGYEAYWQQEIGKRALIEPIGAVATSIFEWWGECWDYAKMSSQIAKLLLAAILDNTLNFNADITTERDRAAAKQLAKIAGVNLTEFTAWYFQAVSETVLADVQGAILGDIKTTTLPTTQEDLAFGQLTVWDATTVLAQVAELRRTMSDRYPNWVLSIISLSMGHNYLLASSSETLEYFAKLLDLETDQEIGVSKRLFLRKEILAKMLKALSL